jgi:hypothetical protein
VRANVVGGNKKVNVRANVGPKKTAESFSNGSLKESLLNAPFNNCYRHKIVVKGNV